MEAGRVRSNETRMKGTINNDNKMTDIYLPRKCDYTVEFLLLLKKIVFFIELLDRKK